MKKCLILMSILSLYACGGGNGGSYVNNIKPIDPGISSGENGNIENITEEAKESNKLTTGLLSEVEKNGKKYHLDDVHFGYPRIKFSIDKFGKIDGVMFSGYEIPVKLKREGDTNKFKSDEQSIHAKLELYGKDVGLKYSDFGLLEIKTEYDPERYNKIHSMYGGYELKRVFINKNYLTNNLTFKGTAVGVVSQSADSEKLNIRDDKATLVFDKTTGKEVLTAKFNNWYDVRVDNNSKKINFTNGDKVSDDKFKFKKEGVIKDSFEGTSSSDYLYSSYYGDNNPQEVVGDVNYDNYNNLKLNMSFGGKIQP